MKKILAVALLDLRRLAFGLAASGLVAGLIPSLASGLGEKVEIRVILGFLFGIVGIAAGASFGNDFAEGKSSFFFARPLPSWVLIAGRFAALLVLSAIAFFPFMASLWVSTSDRSSWTFWVLTQSHAEILLSAWAVSLFIALAVAARGRGVRVDGGLKTMLMIPVRLTLAMGSFLLVFGLFADLVLRAYFGDFTPIKIFAFSWYAAAFVASCFAIAWGRTERLRISQLQGRVMAVHFGLVAVVVSAVWSYVLHPGPESIVGVGYPTWGSNDGRSAFVSARVDRGDGKTFSPVFIVDIGSGQVQRLNSDPFSGPWTSADGATVVWSEATPIFFRPLWRRLGGTTTYRVKTASGSVSPLPMPSRLPDFLSVMDVTRGDSMHWVLPSPDGDTFAIAWDRHLTFTSRSRGEMADVEQPTAGHSGLWEGFTLPSAAFLPSGELRAAQTRVDAMGTRTLTVTDIEPRSGSTKTVASVPIDGPSLMRLDGQAMRVLVTSLPQSGRGGSLSLIDLGGTGGSPVPIVLLQGVLAPSGLFLADGRIAASYSGSLAAASARGLKIFSSHGQLVRDIPLGEGLASRLGVEMFPGLLAVPSGRFNQELGLLDIESGSVVRRFPGLSTPLWGFMSKAAPGTPAARLMQSSDGKLYELPSPAGELRQLLPLPGH